MRIHAADVRCHQHVGCQRGVGLRHIHFEEDVVDGMPERVWHDSDRFVFRDVEVFEQLRTPNSGNTGCG